jgi:hypothetical protein
MQAQLDCSACNPHCAVIRVARPNRHFPALVPFLLMSSNSALFLLE